MALTNLSQIKGGLQLQQDVESLKTSYDAHKVLTDIAYPVAEGEEARSYNVNELLSALKEKISDITGSDDSLSSLKDLSDAINALENKKIKDIVSISLYAEPLDSGWGVMIDQYPALNIPGIDRTKKLPVYSSDNYVLVNEQGGQLYLDLETGKFNGAPSVLDKELSLSLDMPCYKPYEEKSHAIKVFPVGEWTLKDVPSEYLLDNIEMQAIAYRSAIDNLAIDIAKDQQLIEAVKQLIGEKAVAEQLADKVNIADIQTAVRDAETASDEKVVSELAVSKIVKILEEKITAAQNKADSAVLWEDVVQEIRPVKNEIALLSDIVIDQSCGLPPASAGNDEQAGDSSEETSASDELIASEDKVPSEKAVAKAIADIFSYVEEIEAAGFKEDKIVTSVAEYKEDEDGNGFASDKAVASEKAVAKELALISGDVAAVDLKVNENTTNISLIKSGIQTLMPMLMEVADVIQLTREGDLAEFELSHEPNDELVKMNINGLVYYEGIDFEVSREGKFARWTSKEFAINKELTDRIIFTYHTGKFADPTANTTAAVYVTNADLEAYVTKTAAAQTYATKSELDELITIEEVEE